MRNSTKSMITWRRGSWTEGCSFSNRRGRRGTLRELFSASLFTLIPKLRIEVREAELRYNAFPSRSLGAKNENDHD